MGKRPDRAVTVYCNLIRRVYKNVPVIIGGIEASLRRLAHYDYWSDQVTRSVLMDSQADLLSYGMGERSIREIADALAAGIPVSQITWVAGTAWHAKSLEEIPDAELLPDFETVRADKRASAGALPSSMKIRIPSGEGGWRRATASGAMWCRTLRPCPSPRGRWMRSTIFPICGRGTPCMIRREGSRPFPRCASALPAAGAASEAAASAPWPFIREGLSSPEATAPS